MTDRQGNVLPNGHGTDQHIIVAGSAQCPLCKSEISVDLFTEIAGRQRAATLEIERAVEARFARQIAEAERKRKAEIDAAVKAAVRVNETKLAAIRATQEQVVAARVVTEREKLERAKAKAVAEVKAEAFKKEQVLEQRLQDLSRQIQSKTPFQRGEPAEIDLHETLMAAFPGDRIVRIAKGRRGADVLHEVLLPNGDVAGTIILDSKAYAAGRWSNRLTAKLRSDQLDAKADFAVLVSTAFPANTRELHLQDNVLVVSPGRAVVVVAFLRQQVISSHRLKLSAEARDEKGDRLIAFLTSPIANDHFDRLAKATDDMIDLEGREIDIQTGIHRKRGEMIRAIQASYEELVASIESILGGNESLEREPAI